MESVRVELSIKPVGGFLGVTLSAAVETTLGAKETHAQALKRAEKTALDYLEKTKSMDNLQDLTIKAAHSLKRVAEEEGLVRGR